MPIYSPINNVIVRVDKYEEDKEGQFYVDTTYRPEWHVEQKGVVVSIPEVVDKSKIGMENIDPILEVGDSVYFDYKIVDKNRALLDYHFYAPYYSIFCRVRDDIEVIGDWNLIEPLEYQIPSIGGITLPESKRIGKYKCRGIVRYGQMKGKKVYFPDWTRNVNRIEGFDYYCIRSMYIIAYDD